MSEFSILALINKLMKIGKEPVFSGVEHIGIYPANHSDSYDIANWYVDKFGFKQVDGKSSILLQTDKYGFLEIMKDDPQEYSHVAVFTPGFDGALKSLDEHGIEYLQPVIKPDVNIAYLKEPDPCGNLVNLVWRKE